MPTISLSNIRPNSVSSKGVGPRAGELLPAVVGQRCIGSLTLAATAFGAWWS